MTLSLPCRRAKRRLRTQQYVLRVGFRWPSRCGGGSGPKPYRIAPQQRLIDLDVELGPTIENICVLKEVSPDDGVRAASRRLAERLSEVDVEHGMRADVLAVLKRVQADPGTRTREQRRYLERTIRDFERNGLHLPEETRKQVRAHAARGLPHSRRRRPSRRRWRASRKPSRRRACASSPTWARTARRCWSTRRISPAWTPPSCRGWSSATASAWSP